jgi:hypothetical protein
MTPSTPDPITLRRVRNLWQTTRSFGLREITAAWAAYTLVRIDGGPMLDFGQLAPALRAMGYTPVRRRRGKRRVNAWLPPGRPPSPRGRPPGDVPRGDPDVWPLFWGNVVPFQSTARRISQSALSSSQTKNLLR